MTGILPLGHYGIQSGLNCFDEISFVYAENYEEFIGLSKDEVKNLCNQYHMDFDV